MYKKNRGKNFTEDERKLLLDLVMPYKSIVENVKTDNTWKFKKDEVWDKILHQYNCNARQLSGIRNVSQLKSCYSTTKRDTKKENSNKNVEIYKEHYCKNLLSSTDETDANNLIDLITPYKDIIVKNEHPQKIDDIWETILEDYNCQSTTGYKSKSDLQYMYEVYIKQAKTANRENKEEIYKTGGGQSSFPMTTIKEKVMSLLGDKMEPLYNSYDCDSEYRAITVESPVEKNMYKVMTVEPVYDDTGIYKDVKLMEEREEEQTEEMMDEHCTEFDQFLPQQTSQQGNKRKQKPHIEVQSTKNTTVQSSSKKVYEGLNKLVDERSNITSTKLNMEKELYELKIKKAKIGLETAEIEKEIMQKKLISQNLEVHQNEIKEQIFILELKSKNCN